MNIFDKMYIKTIAEELQDQSRKKELLFIRKMRNN